MSEMTSTTNPGLVLSPCTLSGVHDGDTIHVDVPMHFLITEVLLHGYVADVRLAHVNAAELSTADGRAAAAVTAYLAAPDRAEFELLVYGRDKYGRVLADLRFSDGTLLSAYVLTLPGTVPLALERLIA